MTPEQIQELRAKAEAATQGEWWVATLRANVVNAGAREVARCYKSADTRGTLPEANAAYIAAASPSTILALIEVVEAAQKVCAVSDDVFMYLADPLPYEEPAIFAELRRLRAALKEPTDV